MIGSTVLLQTLTSGLLVKQLEKQLGSGLEDEKRKKEESLGSHQSCCRDWSWIVWFVWRNGLVVEEQGRKAQRTFWGKSESLFRFLKGQSLLHWILRLLQLRRTVLHQKSPSSTWRTSSGVLGLHGLRQGGLCERNSRAWSWTEAYR